MIENYLDLNSKQSTEPNSENEEIVLEINEHDDIKTISLLKEVLIDTNRNRNITINIYMNK
jgi:hypothetical protein